MVPTLLLSFQFQYYDQQGKTLRNTSANAVARYTFKGSNLSMTVTMTINYLIISKLLITCIGNSDLYGTNGWIRFFISVVDDDDSKLH